MFGVQCLPKVLHCLKNVCHRHQIMLQSRSVWHNVNECKHSEPNGADCIQHALNVKMHTSAFRSCTNVDKPLVKFSSQSSSIENLDSEEIIKNLDNRYLNFEKSSFLNNLENCLTYEDLVTVSQSIINEPLVPQHLMEEPDESKRILLPPGLRPSLPHRDICARVNAVLDATVPLERQIILKRWQARMHNEMGKEKFLEYMKNLRSEGTSLHNTLQCLLIGRPPPPEAPPKLLRSIEHALRRVQNVIAVEDAVVHPYLAYGGFMDCCATVGGVPTLIEWKTSTKLKTDLSQAYDGPLQMAAYMGALNHDSNYADVKVEQAMIAFAHPDGQAASVFLLEPELCRDKWRQWTHRLATYWLQKQKALLVDEPSAS